MWFRGACHEQACVARSAERRNASDGRVEAVFEGPEAAVGRMVVWCHDGPRHAQVEQVDVQVETPTGESGFHVR